MNIAHPLAPSARIVGTVVNRKEDPRLLTGDDVKFVEIDIDPLPPIVDFETGAETRELVHAGERDSNIFSDMEVPGDDDFEAIFATAPHAIDQTFTHPLSPPRIRAALDAAGA
jgi:CO/xanthine dehydrogenase Mo-binding subunit